MFPYPCPSCSQRLLAPTERVGQRTICPKCLRPLTIPMPESAVALDPKSLIDPTEVPLPLINVSADTNTPFPGSIPIPHFAVEISAAARVGAAPIKLRTAARSGDRTFDLPEVPNSERRSVSETIFPRASMTETPRPTFARTPIHTRRAANADTRAMVMLNPTGLFGVDRAAELSAALSMRMSPPPEPMIDRRLIVGTWAFGTFSAIVLWLGGMFYNPACLPFVALLGAALLGFGLLWRAYLVGRDESPLRGALCLLPPFNVVRLFQKSGDNGHRPLRFAATGVLVLGLFATSASASASASARSFVEKKTAAESPESTAAIIAKLAAREHRADAQRRLVAMGPAAEGELIARLPDADDATALAALDVLSQIGGSNSVSAFKRLAETSKSPLVKSEAAAAAKLLAMKRDE